MQDAELKYSFYLGKFPEHSLDHTFDWNCVNAALNYLDERSRQPDAKPFFLYDLEKDPQELKNRIDDPAYADALGEMRQRMMRFYMETADFVPTKMDKR